MPPVGSSASKTRITYSKISPAGARIPTVSKEGARVNTPETEIAPWEGLYPQTPQLLAGTLIEPPVSVPIAKSTDPLATAVADPLEEPPGTLSGAFGFRGVPKNELTPMRL